MNVDAPFWLQRAFLPASTVHRINGNFLYFHMDQRSQGHPGAMQFPLFSI